VDSAVLYLLIAAAVVILAVVVTAGLLRGRGRSRLPGPTAPGVPPPGGSGSGTTVDVDAGLESAGRASSVDTGLLDTAVLDAEAADADGALDGGAVDLHEVEVPSPARGRLARLRARLARSNTALGKGLLALLSRDTLDERTWEEVEETLLVADLGVSATADLVDRLRQRVRVDSVRDPAAIRALLREELLAIVGPDLDRGLRSGRHDERPAVILVVGVNGTGKTTTVGKLPFWWPPTCSDLPLLNSLKCWASRWACRCMPKMVPLTL